MTLIENKIGIENLSKLPPRIGVTDLSKNTKGWKKELKDKGVLEITDRNDTTGYLISKDKLNELVTELEKQENLIEELTIAMMFDERASSAKWQSGKKLATASKEIISKQIQ